MWVLPFLPPWPVVFVALFVATFFAPLVNGPVFAILTARTPEALRAKAMTAVVAVNTVAAPLGYLVAGQVLERWGVAHLFSVVVIGMTAVGLSFSVVALRRSENQSAPDLAVT
jgi:predicted MFS family arabinose efflux permease